jgi:RNA polymerase sigma-70 factor, ECF subfamily
VPAARGAVGSDENVGPFSPRDQGHRRPIVQAARCGIQIPLAMEAARHVVPDPERSPGTLGAVLYANSSKAVVPEAEWVALVQSVAAGDQRALHALYERAHRVVFTLTMRITANRETAEEVTLDVFHDVWRRASSYDEAGGSVLGWIMNQARSRAIDRLRFEQRKKRAPSDMGGPGAATITVDPDDLVASQQQSQALRSALNVLTADERQAIEAAFFSELTYAEVAERLNQPLGTIKTRIRSGLHKLRQALAERRQTA